MIVAQDEGFMFGSFFYFLLIVSTLTGKQSERKLRNLKYDEHESDERKISK